MALPKATGLEIASEAFSVLREVKDYAIYLIDPAGRILSWNEGAQEIKGYKAEEVIGHNFARFFTEEDRRDGRPARLLACAAAEGRVEDETWRIRKDGSRFWADVVITAIHDAAGGIRGFVKVTRDLTARRHADELLRQSEERLRLMVESVKDYAIFMLDPEGRVTSWNSGAERIKGYAANEVLGKNFSLFYPPELIAIGHPMMPVMDGKEFRALLRDDVDLGQIPVVILTAHANILDATKGMDVAACLKKPIRLDALLAIVDRFCRKHDAPPFGAPRA